MNVQEVERKTGLTRANIRFYEKQGLLKPLRKANGYRDYSSDDVKELLKIKLMRELDISIEDIDRLQREEEKLSSVINERISAISEERETLSDSRMICQSISEEGADFSELEAEKYLEELERLAKERGMDNAGRLRKRQDVLQETLHPWRRYFARMIDESIYTMVVMLIFYLGFHGENSLTWIICGTLLVMVMTVITEGILLAGFGTTIGKWLFGIHVLSADGKKLSWQEAAERTGRVLWHGQALEIPLWSIYREYKCYDAYTDGETLPWDDNCLYLMEEKKGIRYGLAVFVTGTLILINGGFGFPSEDVYKLPVNYGDLTVGEFAENYNKYLELYGLIDKECLNRDGKWEHPKALQPQFEYELEDGVIKKVSYEIDYTGNERNPDYIDEVTCALLAWEGGRHSTPWGLMLSERISEIEEDMKKLADDFHDDYADSGEIYHNIAEIYGYQSVDGSLIPQSDVQEGRVHITFMMEK